MAASFRWTKGTAGMILPLLFVFVFSAGATTFQTDDDIHISNLHQIDDDLYAFCQNIRVDGVINGDLIVGAYNIITNGRVEGSQDVAGYKLYHTGTVGNSLRAFVNTAIIEGSVDGSVLMFGYDCQISQGAVIGKDVTARGFSVRIDGTVKRNVDVLAERIVISGNIEGDVTLEGKRIKILPPAVILGDVTYTSEEELKIDTTAGVVVKGNVKWLLPEKTEEEEAEGETFFSFQQIIFKLSKLFAAFLFGIILLSLFRTTVTSSLEELRSRFAVSAATGFLFLLILLAAIVILVISSVFLIVGLALVSGKLALLGAIILILSMLMVPISTFTVVSGGMIFYSGKILIAFLLGYLIVRIFSPQAATINKKQLFLGLVVLSVLCSIPYFGVILYIVVCLIGAGGIVLGLRKKPLPKAEK